MSNLTYELMKINYAYINGEILAKMFWQLTDNPFSITPERAFILYSDPTIQRKLNRAGINPEVNAIAFKLGWMEAKKEYKNLFVEAN